MLLVKCSICGSRIPSSTDDVGWSGDGGIQCRQRYNGCVIWNNETEVFVDNWLWDLIAKKVSLVDDITLKKIALETGWNYYRIYDSITLERHLDRIIKDNNFSTVEKYIILSFFLYIISVLFFMLFSFINIKYK